MELFKIRRDIPFGMAASLVLLAVTSDRLVCAGATDRIGRPDGIVMLALYIGGMGAKGANFHYEVFARMGYEDACAQIQELYLGGRKDEAIAAVPLELVEQVALVGPAAKIAEEVPDWRDSLVTTLVVSGTPDTLRLAAELLG